jgi:hypothetical protein
MGFMNGKVVGAKADIRKANVIGNIFTSIFIAAFIVVIVLAVTGVITF